MVDVKKKNYSSPSAKTGNPINKHIYHSKSKSFPALKMICKIIFISFTLASLYKVKISYWSNESQASYHEINFE